MGLGFYVEGESIPDKPSWSYSGFHEFRACLAEQIGISNLRKMVHFGGKQSWYKYQSDPITILLMHSDCDGQLSADDCGKIAPRLRELLSHLADDYDKENGSLLADLMELCATKGKPLEFC